MNTDKIYENPFYDNIEYEKVRIKRMESQIKEEPTKKDLREVISVLKDFDVHVSMSDIPKVRSVFELELWKNKKIKERLK